jgi:hypothetical protein
MSSKLHNIQSEARNTRGDVQNIHGDIQRIRKVLLQDRTRSDDMAKIVATGMAAVAGEVDVVRKDVIIVRDRVDQHIVDVRFVTGSLH